MHKYTNYDNNINDTDLSQETIDLKTRNRKRKSRLHLKSRCLIAESLQSTLEPALELSPFFQIKFFYV